MQNPDGDGEPVEAGLSREEDDELRRLSFFSTVGALSEEKLNRFRELRERDRREEVRPPREFELPDDPPQHTKIRTSLRYLIKR